MSEATAATPAPEVPQTREGQIALLSDLAAGNRAVFAEAVRIAGGPMTAEDRTVVLMLARRAADIEGVELAILDLLNQEVRLRTVEEVMARADRAMVAAVPDPVPAPRHRRHRAPRGAQRPLYPRSLKGLVPLGAVVTAVRHSWPLTHPVVAGTIATAAAGITVATAAVVPHAASTFGSGSPAGTPAPSASVWSAVPAPVAGPPQIASAVTRPKAGAGSSRTLTVLAPPPLPAYVPPYAPSPGGGHPAPQDSPQPAQGTLSVSTTALDATGTGGGTLTLSCSGGPCDWHVVAGGPVSADVERGSLQDGESADVALTVDPATLMLNGSGTVTVWPGDIQVQVSWSAPAAPSADPSPVDTTLPSAAASAP